MEKADDGGIRIYLRLRAPVSSQHSSLMSSTKAGNQPLEYEIDHEFNASTFKIVSDRSSDGGGDLINNSREFYHFKFRRVLEPTTTQEKVFNVVAKDCVDYVLQGYNSTIFAYGQTGSGKTFSITGGTESYEDRGIIPRALAMIYEEIEKRKDFNWTVYLSYLQIYNDKGQDLLNHGKDAKNLDDLPVVTIQEGEDEIYLNNLDQHHSPTLSDALSLLFLGDTNRLYCETPMNKTSSRSHCVFTVSLEARAVNSPVVRRSKLNLVDLAGSERVAKSGVDGTVLTEAKYINLSLHYLEHVIISLTEQAKGRRDHIPFRNSFMTMVLRDSLGSNCRTSMLATVHTARSMIPETISTCQFAQRVAMIRQNAHVNEETDPFVLVKKLRVEISELKDRLAFAESQGGGSGDRALTEDEYHMCEHIVEKYLRCPDPEARIEGFEGDLARIYGCFGIMKKIVVDGGLSSESGGGGTRLKECEAQLEVCKSQMEALQISLQQKENEMTMLFDMLRQTAGPKCNAGTQTTSLLENCTTGPEFRRREAPVGAVEHNASEHASPPLAISQLNGLGTTKPAPPSTDLTYVMATVSNLANAGKLNEAQATAVTEFLKDKEASQNKGLVVLTDAELLQNRAAALEAFKQSYKGYEKVEEMKLQLKERYASCKSSACKANAINEGIKKIKREILSLRADRAVSGSEEVSEKEASLLAQLHKEKLTFTALIDDVKKDKETIKTIETFLERSKDQLSKHFEEWLSARQHQVNLALRAAQPTQPTGPPPEPAPVSSTAKINPSNEYSTSLPSLSQSYPANPLRSSSVKSNKGADLTISIPTPPRSAYPSTAPPFAVTDGRLEEDIDGVSRNVLNRMSLDPPPSFESTLTYHSPSGSPLQQIPPTTGRGELFSESRSNGQASDRSGRSSNVYHLQPLHNDTATQSGQVGVSGLSTGALRDVPNPFAPIHRSTGDPSADQELAALYRAREEMRQNFRG